MTRAARLESKAKQRLLCSLVRRAGLCLKLLIGLFAFAYAAGSGHAQAPSLSLGNRVWVDTNGNGLRDTTESGLVGLTLQLWTPGVNGT